MRRRRNKFQEAKTGVYILLNDEELLMGIDSPTRAMGQIFFCFISKLNYFSTEALQDLIFGATEVVEGLLIYKKSALLQRQIRGVQAFVARTDDRDELLRYIFDQVLVAECLSTLPGFGYVYMEKNEDGGRRIKFNFGINPEKTSLYSVS